MKQSLFVTCSQGLEPLLMKELTALGCNRLTLGYRGVYVDDVTMEMVYRINYCSRIGCRVLLPLNRFRCNDADGLYRGINTIDWLQYIPLGKTFAIDANVQHRKLRNSLFAAQVSKDAICDQFNRKIGKRPSVDTAKPDVQLNLFIHDEKAIISIDTSGVPLHKRGYRQQGVEAPLRESLAAAMLSLAEYQSEEIFYDPCCGSGTMLIEAALMASQTPPGFLRLKWGFMYLPQFSQEEWLKVKVEADQKRISLPKGRFFGADINKSAIQACKANLRAAGLHQVIDVVAIDFRDYSLAVQPTFLLTNPPHGNRLEHVDGLRPLYRAIGDFMKQNMTKPSRGYVFVGNLELSKEVGLAPKKRHVFDHSGIESRLLEFEIY